MAAPRGPARPTGLLSLSTARSVCRRPPLDGRHRARPSAASHYCRPARPAWPGAPCPEYASRRPAPSQPPSRPPALQSGPQGRREGPPGKEDYAPHNAPRQKPLTSGAGRACSGLFAGHRDSPRRADFSPTRLTLGGLERRIRLELCRLERPSQGPGILMGVGRRASLQCASALGMCPRKLQVPKCLALNLAAAAPKGKVGLQADQDSDEVVLFAGSGIPQP